MLTPCPISTVPYCFWAISLTRCHLRHLPCAFSALPSIVPSHLRRLICTLRHLTSRPSCLCRLHCAILAVHSRSCLFSGLSCSCPLVQAGSSWPSHHLICTISFAPLGCALSLALSRLTGPSCSCPVICTLMPSILHCLTVSLTPSYLEPLAHALWSAPSCSCPFSRTLLSGLWTLSLMVSHLGWTLSAPLTPSHLCCLTHTCPLAHALLSRMERLAHTLLMMASCS